MDALIPPSKICGLTQVLFVGSVSDNFNERIEQKIFHCEIVVDAEKAVSYTHLFEMMQPCSTAKSGNLFSSVVIFDVFLIVFLPFVVV